MCGREKEGLSSEKVGKFTLQSGSSHDLLDRVGFLGTCGALTVDGGLRPVLYHGLRVEREKGYLSRN